MPLAQGTQAEQAAAIEAIATALRSGELPLAAAQRAAARLDALARRYPAAPQDYAAIQRATDDALMRTGWARGLTAFGPAHAPARDTTLRVITQRSVDCDGVSEAGAAAEQVLELFAGFPHMQLLALDDLRQLDAAALPRDGKFNVLVSNHRKRYLPAASTAPVDLHLALWNPFQVFDVAAPAVVTWGYANGALAALRDWLAGRAAAPGRSPVSLSPHPATS